MEGSGLSPLHRVPIARQLTAHVVLFLTLVFNLGININLSQHTKGTHMTKTIHQSAASIGNLTRAQETVGEGCVGLKIGDTGSGHFILSVSLQ